MAGKGIAGTVHRKVWEVKSARYVPDRRPGAPGPPIPQEISVCGTFVSGHSSRTPYVAGLSAATFPARLASNRRALADSTIRIAFSQASPTRTTMASRDKQLSAVGGGGTVQDNPCPILHEKLHTQEDKRGSVFEINTRQQGQQRKLPVMTRVLLSRQPESNPTNTTRDPKPVGTWPFQPGTCVITRSRLC
jgi:hypothetical protein